MIRTYLLSMNVSEIIAAVLLLAALVTSLLAILMSLRIKNSASNDPSMKGLFIIPFIIFSSYSLIVILLLRNSHFRPDLITGCIIFLGACFFFYIVNLIKTMIMRLLKETKRRKKVEERLRELAIVDSETNLYNYRGFLNLIEHHLLLAKRDKKGVLVCYVDIENLDQIKMTLGLQEAKFMISETAKLLKKSFRASDIIARVGEYEFMVFLIGSSKEHADAVAKNFQQRLETFNEKRSEKYRLPINFCMAPYNPIYNHIFENIHAQADDFMSAIKNAKECAVVYS